MLDISALRNALGQLETSLGPFKLYRDNRNETAHAYDSTKAEEVVSVVDAFVEDVRFLRDALARRNHAGA